MKKLFLTLLVLTISYSGFSQKYKFGKVSKQELEEQFYPTDSTAGAAFLYKKRDTYTTVIAGKVQLVSEIFVRIKIYNKEGYDWATESIPLFGTNNSSREKVTNFKAQTYNLENGKIAVSKLDKKQIFDEQIHKSLKVKKFTMPNVKNGSIIEWSYKLYSSFISSIDDVVVQYAIPVKKFDAKIRLLEYFTFRKRVKGYYHFDIKESVVNNVGLGVNDNIIDINEENIPALNDEQYVNNINNYVAALKLEVSSFRIASAGIFENYTTSWNEIAKDIYRSSSFGEELNKTNHLSDDIAEMKTTLTTFPQKVGGALQFVKSKIKWNGNYGKYTQKGLSKAYKEGTGNVSDINLTLIAVLRELGVNANPVLVSTRNNGVPLSPTKRGFNYVVAYVESDQGNVLLDASEKYSLPNVLPVRALNWQGTVVRPDKSVDFVSMSSSAISTEEINLNYKISDDGLVEGMNRNKYLNNAALSYRSRYGSVGEEDLISNIEENNDDIEILNYRATNVDNLSKPVIEMYKFEKEDGVEVIGDKMYISPLLYETTTENPFKLDDRQYPIDFGTKWEEKISVTIQIPEGYTVETLPENTAIGMTDEVGVFIYSVKNAGSKIQISSNIKMNDDVIPSTYYAELKELFKLIVAKQTEKIVLTKK